ncbi:MAG: NusG domain II-containing protein [bacterium]
MSGPWSARAILGQMTVADGIVAAGVLALSLVLAASSRLPAGRSTRAIVTVGGEAVLEIPMDRDAEYRVAARLGEVTLAVAGGAIRVVEARCSQRICVGMGAKRRPGELIACVPNALLVRLDGADPDAPDAVIR